MNLQIDRHVKAVFDEIIAAAPDPGPPPSGEFHDDERRPQRVWLAVAAVAMLLAGIGATIVATLLRTAPADQAATSATVMPLPVNVLALLEPVADSSVQVADRSRFEPEQPTVGGAVVAPDGTVFGIALVPTAPLDLAVFPDSYDERTIADRPAWGMVDGSAPEEIYRGIEVGCATLSVTTAGEAMWSTDTELLAALIESDGTAVTIRLPDGWASLGTAMIESIYNSTLEVRVNDTDYRVQLTQAIGAPVGPLLATMESNPTVFIHGTDELWHVAGATTPGYNTLVGRQHDTAFSLTGNAPIDVLTQVVDALAAVPASDWLQRPTSPELIDDTDITSGALPSCNLRRLDVIEPA